MKYIIFLISLLPSVLVSQTSSLPEPQCGWDSLKAHIKYPNIGRRAGYRIAMSVRIEIDSSGKLTSISAAPFSDHTEGSYTMGHMDSLFVKEIINALRSVSWYPGTIDGIRTSTQFDLPVVFNLYEYDRPYSQRPVIVVDTVRPKVEKNLMH